ncbi:MAG TPA: CapA family protein [Terriglobia bacterium]|nr:CapA family protein [Terriglobia bacterium]
MGRTFLAAKRYHPQSLPSMRPLRFLKRCGAIFAIVAFVSSAGLAQNPAPVTPLAARRQTLLFVGDVMLSRSVGAKIKEQNDWNYPFEKIADTLRAADLAIANLECPVSDVGRNLHHLYSFRADPRVIEGLKYAGFGVLGVANNHMYDWDRPALLDTVQRLRAAGLRPVGAGANSLEAHYPVLVNLNGVRLAFLAYVGIEPKEAEAGPDQPGVAWLDADRVLGDIRFARPLADVLIVCLHWGVEYAPRPTRNQVELAHRMIDAGADLVVGGHPHVVQPCEIYHGHWIAYSLGNFIFDQHWPSTHHGIMLKVTLAGKQITDATTIPITIDNSFQAFVTPVDQLPKRKRTPVLRAQ